MRSASTSPVNTNAEKPMSATPPAAAHCFTRVQSPSATTSLIAPMVQKRVARATAPNNTDSTKAATSASVLRRETCSMDMPRF
ncbi:hypothetical protein D3C78_1896540 [compost metagenome]